MKSGDIFGDWTALQKAKSRFRPSGARIPMWFCECSCGKIKAVEVPSLVHRRSKSCGHYKRLTGSKNPSWRGGKSKHKAGYVVINGIKIGGRYLNRKLEHTSIMENFLGRRLKKEELVHHKNGIRYDNRIENLELWTCRHPKGQRVADLIKWAIEILTQYKPEVLK